jgi:Fur family ferric uptake transcriptional regulator
LSQNRKLRMTHQRQVILEEIKKVDTHPTADEVYEMVRRRLRHISLSTVYRNLDILSEYGMIQKLELGGGQKRFDGRTEKHYHIRCIRCGRVGDLTTTKTLDIENALGGKSDYEIVGHRLELLGLCPKCKNEKQDQRKRITGGHGSEV